MIEVNNLNFRYRHDLAPVLSQFGFKAESGQLTLLSGPTGCGKSTLLKAIIGLAPNFTGGEISGSIKIFGSEVVGMKPHDLAHLIGYVNQQPECAFATDTVEEELAFGMEQLGFSHHEMQSRVQATAELIGLSHRLKDSLEQLSGGEQQKVAIGAAIAAGQKILLLDEPTSALDGRSAIAVLELLRRLAREEGFAVLLSEHRIERLLPFVDRVVQLEPDEDDEQAGQRPSKIADNNATILHSGSSIIYARGLRKTYGAIEALQAIDIDLSEGDVLAVVGDNGSGKSSLLWALLEEAWAQSVEVAMVPQTASDLLFLNTVSAELAEANELGGLKSASVLLQKLASGIDQNSHPRDLSAGQQLALVIALQLAKNARLLILDEPTRGLDKNTKARLAELITILAEQGHAVIFATHDNDFAASVSNRTLTLEQGRVTHV